MSAQCFDKRSDKKTGIVVSLLFLHNTVGIMSLNAFVHCLKRTAMFVSMKWNMVVFKSPPPDLTYDVIVTCAFDRLANKFNIILRQRF